MLSKHKNRNLPERDSDDTTAGHPLRVKCRPTAPVDWREFQEHLPWSRGTRIADLWAAAARARRRRLGRCEWRRNSSQAGSMIASQVACPGMGLTAGIGVAGFRVCQVGRSLGGGRNGAPRLRGPSPRPCRPPPPTACGCDASARSGAPARRTCTRHFISRSLWPAVFEARMALPPTACRQVMFAGLGDSRRDAGVTGRAPLLGQLLAVALARHWGDSGVHGWVNSGKDG